MSVTTFHRVYMEMCFDVYSHVRDDPRLEQRLLEATKGSLTCDTCSYGVYQIVADFSTKAAALVCDAKLAGMVFDFTQEYAQYLEDQDDD